MEFKKDYIVLLENITDIRCIPIHMISQIKGSQAYNSDDSFTVTLTTGEELKQDSGFKEFMESLK